VIGSRVVTTSSLNLRYEPSMSSGVAAVAPSGTVVKVTGNRVGFVAVSWDGLKGWMHSDYLSSTNAALSLRGGSGTPTNPGTSPNNPAPGGGGSGSSIVSYAMNYVGYPYVWAGEGPYGFDCSGFVMYVIKNVLGLSITHDMFVQYDMGAPVARNALQPGDIVFFQNTFRWGMSHNGIYIGNGQFVHAENETTGVRVSDINSQYYSSRYYGAVRFT
jgi:cell wall-associated NlpC family hydrolase